MTRTKMIGLAAVIAAALGYGGMVLTAVLAKMGVLASGPVVIAAAIALGLLGEAGLWVAATSLGWALFKGRKALLQRLFGRRAEPV